MKASIVLVSVGAAATAFASSSSVCPGSSNTHATGAALQKIIDYKKSPHALMGGYYRIWTDKVANPQYGMQTMDDLPDCLDIAFAFPEGGEPDAFYQKLNSTYAPALQARGTKVVQTIGINTLLSKSYPNTQQGYNDLAAYIYKADVTDSGLDGVDIDVEQSLSGEDLQRATGVFLALGKLVGPKSGTNKLLIFDTNRSGNEALFRNVYSVVSYVLVQSYGRSVSGLQGTWNTFSPYIRSDQYMIGFSFNEGDNTWHDTDPPISSSRAQSWAKWQPSGTTKAGIFSYAIDLDGNNPPSQPLNGASTYDWTRYLISVMNP